MNRTTRSLLVIAGLAGSALADIADFQDVPIDAQASFVTGGLLIEADGPNAVFGPGAITGAVNGTNIFGWCGSDCNPGAPQLVTISSAVSESFNLSTIDAGNLWRAEDELGFRDGMTLELIGNLLGGGQVFASLLIVEDTFTTYNLAGLGFDNLESLQLFTPSTQDGFPDPTIDNIVYTIPSPNALLPLAMGGLITLRRRR